MLLFVFCRSSAHFNCTELSQNSSILLPQTVNTSIPTQAKHSRLSSWSYFSLDSPVFLMSGVNYENWESLYEDNMFPLFHNETNTHFSMSSPGLSKSVERFTYNHAEYEIAESACPEQIYTSVILFLVGLVTSRIGALHNKCLYACI